MLASHGIIKPGNCYIILSIFELNGLLLEIQFCYKLTRIICSVLLMKFIFTIFIFCTFTCRTENDLPVNIALKYGLAAASITLCALTGLFPTSKVISQSSSLSRSPFMELPRSLKWATSVKQVDDIHGFVTSLG